MTSNYLLPAIWGLVLLAALTGYGKLLRRLLFKDEPTGWANEAAWGMALIVAIGGVLNLFHLVSRPLVIMLVTAGLAGFAVDGILRRKLFTAGFKALAGHIKSQPGAAALKSAGGFILFALVVIQYLGAVTLEVTHPNYIVMDDLRAYFLFPKQMLQAGGITADPFNIGRLANGLGGQAILHALILVFFDFFNLLLMEAGVALMICVGLIWRIAGDRGLGYPWKWALAFFFLCLPYYPSLRINASSFTLGMVMLLALFAFLDRDRSASTTPVRNAFIIAMLAACAGALKTTFLPPVVVILACSYAWHLTSSRFNKAALLETVLVPAFTLALLLPWMIALLNSSGTMLYHVLGTGFDEYNYGNYIDDSRIGDFSLQQKLTFIFLNFFARDIYLALLIGGAAVFLVARWRQRAAVQAFVVGSVVSACMVMFKVDVTKVVSLNRYFYPVTFVALLLVLAELATVAAGTLSPDSPHQSGRRRHGFGGGLKSTLALGTLAVIGLLFFWQSGYAGRSWDFYRFHVNNLPEQMRSRGTFFPEDWQALYQRIQGAVPEGATILSYDTATAAYDFGRNRIYYLTTPGACSPPPGLPYFSGPEKVADYLLAHDVRYIAYNYQLDGGFPIRENIYRIRPEASYTNRIFTRADFALGKVFHELGASRARVYDDGSRFVLDLKTPAPVPLAYRPPNYFQDSKILTPAWASTSGFDRNKIWTDGHGVIEGIHYQPEAGDRLLVLNTFGYHPWKGDASKLGLVLSVNGTPLPLVGYLDNRYYFSLAPVRAPITTITIDSTTFVPRNENVRFGKDDDRKTLGIDVDTIEIRSRPD